ncbi:MAG: hypothetical protein PVSMB11_10500 [Desulfuromonadaceae bacterium]
MTIRISLLLISIFVCTQIFTVLPCQAEDVCGPMTPAEEQILKLQQEHSLLTARVKELEARRCIPEERLLQKKFQQLKETAADAKLQRQSIEDFYDELLSELQTK